MRMTFPDGTVMLAENEDEVLRACRAVRHGVIAAEEEAMDFWELELERKDHAT